MEDRYLFKAKTAQIVGIYNNGLEDGVWVHGSLRCDVGKYTIFQFETERADYVEYEIDPSTICQCTGLKDKNGKLIWENDIVKKEFYIDYDSVYQEEYVTSVISKKYVGTVKFEHFAWVVETFNDKLKCILPICELSEHSEDIKHFEVIGNIFDNPGLLRRNDE